MKKSIRETKKTNKASFDKKDARPFNTKATGYKENIYNDEEQAVYQESKAGKNKTENTAGPKD